MAPFERVAVIGMDFYPTRPIAHFRNGTFVDMAAERARGINPSATARLHLDNTGHPAADCFALAHASKTQIRALALASTYLVHLGRAMSLEMAAWCLSPSECRRNCR
jgi:hypothetical protein